MTDAQMRAYARAGLTARLADLEREQGELRQLLATLTAAPDEAGSLPPVPSRTMSADARKRIGDAARQRWATHRAARTVGGAEDVAGAGPEPDVARVLPRRGRLGRRPVQALPPAAVLPPMPRLIKAQAG